MTLESLNNRNLHRGADSSRAFNARNETIRQDINRLYGLLSENDQSIEENMDILLREHFFMQNYIEELKSEVARLKRLTEEEVDAPRGANYSTLLENFYEIEHITNGEGKRAAYIDRLHGLVSPQPSHTASRVSYITETGEVVIPKGLVIYGKEAKDTERTTDGELVYKDITMTHAERMIDHKAHTFWVRDVSFPKKEGVTEVFGELHFKLPTEGLTSLHANTLVLHPYPEGSMTLRDIQYKGHGNQWHRLEHFPTEIVDGEEVPRPIKNSRKHVFQFNRSEVTEVRLLFSQPYGFEHEDQTRFTYGFQHIGIEHRLYTERQCEFVTTLDITDKHAELSRVYAPEVTPAPGTPQNLTDMVSHELYYDASLNERFDFGNEILTPLSKVYIKTILTKQGGTVPALKAVTIPYLFKEV